MSFHKPLHLIASSRLVAITTLAVALFFSASAARAGCAPSKVEVGPRIPFVGASAVPASSHSDDDYKHEPAAIVGLWHAAYTATYSTSGPLPVPVVPPGSFPFVQSYKTWHSDGTEFENAFLPPAAGNICFGVWKELEDSTFKLHHIGLMFAPDGSPANVFTVDEIDRVSRDGKTYSGTFDFKIFSASDVLGAGAPLQEIKGTTAGTRITVD
jgi:hypothetical protein